MLSDLFLNVLTMSIQGSFFILFVLLIRKFLHFAGAPRLINTFLWCAVLFQLLCPIRLPYPSSFSTLSALETNMQNTTAMLSHTVSSVIPEVLELPDIPEVLELPDPLVFSSTNDIASQPLMQENAAQTSSFWVTIKSLFVSNHYNVLLFFAGIWLTGMLVLVLRGMIQYSFLQKQVATAYRIKEKDKTYYVSDDIHTPFILGVFSPKIYLPKLENAFEKSYIYCHEQAHLKHGDFFIKPLFYLALCVHWFNPFLWVAIRHIANDMEAACDETVLSTFDVSIKADYCTSLLRFAHAPRYATMPLCFGEGDFTTRIKDILQYKKPKFWAILSGAFLVIFICLCTTLFPVSSANYTENVVTDTVPTSTHSAQSVTQDSKNEASNSTSDEQVVPSLTTATPSAITGTILPTPSMEPSLEDILSDDITRLEDAEITNVATTQAELFLWPVPEYDYISRWSEVDAHNGLDIAAEADTAIYAASDGVVLCAGYNAAGTGYGYSIIIDHGDGYQTLYAHGLSVVVSAGDVVSQGDYIMPVGSTGYSAGNHLHFEILLEETSIFLEEDYAAYFTSDTTLPIYPNKS